MNFGIVIRKSVPAILLLTAMVGTSCSTGSTQAYIQVTKATLNPGDPIPMPGGTTILEVTGDIHAMNDGDFIHMDLDTIKSVGMVEYTVEDPNVGEKVTFRGPLMSSLLDLWQIGKNATILHIVALDDYTIDVSISDMRKYPIMFAVQANGNDMTIGERGPAMLVYPYHVYTFERPLTDNYWIWQIKSVEVK